MDLRETLAKAAEAVREKTDMAVNTGRMALEVSRARADANAARIELADLVMNRYVSGQITDEEILALCAEIEDADEQIAEMVLALDAIKEETLSGLRSVGESVTGIFKKESAALTCPVCGNALEERFVFCPTCGCRLETVDDIVDSAEELDDEDGCCGDCAGCTGCGEEPAEYVEAGITEPTEE